MNKKTIKIFTVLIIILIICIIFAGIQIEKNIEQSKIVKTNVEVNTQVISEEIVEINKEKLNIFYFNVGQADSILIIYMDVEILIDAGNVEDGEEIVAFLKNNNINQIDYIIGTHVHEDHIGGMATIVDNIDFEKIILPLNKSNTSKYYSKLKNSVQCKNCEIINVETNNIFEISNNVNFKIVYVDNYEPENVNNSSIILQLNFYKQKYLFMGDCEKDVENILIKEQKIEDVDVLKVGHHGSNSSTSETFINVVLPEISIISVEEGKYNNVPSEKVMNRLKDKGKLYRTDENGTIWLVSDGEKMNVFTIFDLCLDGND